MSDGFFQTHARLTGKKELPPPAGTALTVTQLTRQIEKAIKAGVPAGVQVKGEVSNYRGQRGGSGHLYFTLKDAGACVDCVMWADAAARMKFALAEGLEVLVGGYVGVYADRGKYQLYVSTLSPLGQGALELAFRQLRDKLHREGLFAAERKKELPRYPARIALVTSSSTAALQDILKVLRRFAWLRLMLYHVPVQGGGAAEKIAAGLAELNRRAGQIDVIILARGGGSLEDLWAFNEEAVARAIAASLIPIVTGIGHEVDVSIADLVADHHAHTPTEAAQTVTAAWRNVRDAIELSGARLRKGLRQIVEAARQRLSSAERHEFFRRPRQRINELRQMLDDRQRAMNLAMITALQRRMSKLSALEWRAAQRHPRHAILLWQAKVQGLNDAMRKAISDNLRRKSAALTAMQNHLNAVGPEQVLRRGYTITTRKKSGEIVRKAGDVKTGRLFSRGSRTEP